MPPSLTNGYAPDSEPRTVPLAPNSFGMAHRDCGKSRYQSFSDSALAADDADDVLDAAQVVRLDLKALRLLALVALDPAGSAVLVAIRFAHGDSSNINDESIIPQNERKIQTAQIDKPKDVLYYNCRFSCGGCLWI